MEKQTWKALYNNEATVEIKPNGKTSPLLENELSVIVNGKEEFTASTYTEASNWLVNVVNNNPYELIDAEDIVRELVESILDNDGVTIEDTIRDDVGSSVDYLGDGIWLVNSKQLDVRDVSCLLKEHYIQLKGPALADKYNENSDEKIVYLQDSLFDRV